MRVIRSMPPLAGGPAVGGPGNELIGFVWDDRGYARGSGRRPTFVLKRGAHDAPAGSGAAGRPVAHPSIPGRRAAEPPRTRALDDGSAKRPPGSLQTAPGNSISDGAWWAPSMTLAPRAASDESGTVLDWLALDVYWSGWDPAPAQTDRDVATHRQDSDSLRRWWRSDPENRLLARSASPPECRADPGQCALDQRAVEPRDGRPPA